MRNHPNYPYASVFSVAENILAAKTPNDLFSCFKKSVDMLLPLSLSEFGIGNVLPLGFVPLVRISCSLPLGADLFTAADGYLDNTHIDAWSRSEKPHLLRENKNGVKSGIKYASSRMIGIHGLRDVRGTTSSYFSFVGSEGEMSNLDTRIIELLVPHLHLTLTKLWNRGELKEFSTQLTARITRREQEVLQLMFGGKSNKEIAKILSISGLTVKNHVKSIFQKMSAKNRCDAISKGLKYGIIHMDSNPSFANNLTDKNNAAS